MPFLEITAVSSLKMDIQKHRVVGVSKELQRADFGLRKKSLQTVCTGQDLLMAQINR
jgi:hypothetical protein